MIFPPLAMAGGRKKFSVISSHILREDDPTGHGAYGASRGNRKHQGIDLLVRAGEGVYAPFAGRITHTRPYANDTRFGGLRLQGEGKYADYLLKIFYLQPTATGSVTKGDLIGKAQAISLKYSPQMKDHLHIELYIQGKRVDPTPYFL